MYFDIEVAPFLIITPFASSIFNTQPLNQQITSNIKLSGTDALPDLGTLRRYF